MELHENASGDGLEQGFRFDQDDLNFLAEVARRIEPLAARPGLTPEEAAVIGQAVAALRQLPQVPPGIDVRIEVAHRMGGEGFSESYSYTVVLGRERVEVTSSGTQCDPEAGSNSFTLESLVWHSDGQTACQGNRDTWLERLSYALARDHTLQVGAAPGGDGTEAV